MPSGSVYCPSCGQSVAQASSYQSVPSELDALARDRNAQELWLYRLLAFLVDVLIVGVGFAILEFVFLLAFFPLAIALSFLTFPFAFINFTVSSGVGSVVLVFYFTFSEWFYGRSIGKSFFQLRVVTLDDSRLDFVKAFIRNISKIFWPFLLLDIFAGLISKTRRGQKYSDYVANTNVIKVELTSARRVSGQSTAT